MWWIFFQKLLSVQKFAFLGFCLEIDENLLNNVTEKFERPLDLYKENDQWILMRPVLLQVYQMNWEYKTYGRIRVTVHLKRRPRLSSFPWQTFTKLVNWQTQQEKIK